MNQLIDNLLHTALYPLQTQLLALLGTREAIPIIDELDSLDVLVDSAIVYAELLQQMPPLANPEAS